MSTHTEYELPSSVLQIWGKMKFFDVYIKIIIKLTTFACVKLMKVEIFHISFFTDLSLKTEHSEKETNSSNR